MESTVDEGYRLQMFATLNSFMQKHQNETSATRLEYNQLMNHMTRLQVRDTHFPSSLSPSLVLPFYRLFLSSLSLLFYLFLSLSFSFLKILLSCCANFLGVCSVLAPLVELSALELTDDFSLYYLPPSPPSNPTTLTPQEQKFAWYEDMDVFLH